MNHEKQLQALLSACTVFAAVIILFKYSLLAQEPPEIIRNYAFNITRYYVTVAIFFMSLFANLLLRRLKINRPARYTSYFDQKSALKKKPIPPSAKEIWEAFAGCCTTPKYIICGLALFIILAANHASIFFPGFLSRLPQLLFDYDNYGNIAKNNIWLAVSAFSILLLGFVIINQNHHIRANNRLVNRQNLIINAHSNIAIGKLRATFMNIDRTFLSLNKLEYILNAKTPNSLKLSGGQILLHLRIDIKLNNDYSVTEFYIRHLSILMDDVALECANYQTKFHQIFTVDNEFILSFYVKFTDADEKKLEQKFNDKANFLIYYNFIVKNSFGVITDMFGSAVYKKSPEQNTESFDYITDGAKANQYFYI